MTEVSLFDLQRNNDCNIDVKKKYIYTNIFELLQYNYNN